MDYNEDIIKLNDATKIVSQPEPFVSKKFLEELDFLADKHGVISIAYGEYGNHGKQFSIMTLDDEIKCVDSTIEGVIHKAFKIEFGC